MPTLWRKLARLPLGERIGIASLALTAVGLLIAWAAWQWPSGGYGPSGAPQTSPASTSPTAPQSSSAVVSSPSRSETSLSASPSPTTTRMEDVPKLVRVPFLEFCLQTSATGPSEGEPGCSELRYATVGDKQLGFVNKSLQAIGGWDNVVAVPNSRCTEVHLEFGSVDVDGLATGDSAVRLTFADRNPVVARASEGRIGRLDVQKLKPGGPMAIQISTEWSNSTVGLNGYLICEEGSIQ